MFKFITIVLACYKLGFILAAPADLANMAPPPTVYGNAPVSYMDPHNFRNRKFSSGFKAPMIAPTPEDNVWDRENRPMNIPSEMKSITSSHYSCKECGESCAITTVVCSILLCAYCTVYC
ncbi:hypothetical protein PGT21_018408 [Puccinia graminis f. sp. tritici]|uniref:Uncharacterized protein n=1 Tax=Puccinia graminis f. sp. tritici TaxID=56615 RepID=A0A5B0Q319_PUCGR|nr:hypothetical protein PGT21_018408 [Puccinia graminis f. sp. tritici]KAA1124639.1 hypothetical protein PGTUg99_025344 [Puccinia graminis f. sp. tritici]